MFNGQGPRVQAAQLAAVPLTGRITLAEGQKNEREQRLVRVRKQEKEEEQRLVRVRKQENEREQRLVRVRKTKGSSQTFGQQRDKET